VDGASTRLGAPSGLSMRQRSGLVGTARHNDHMSTVKVPQRAGEVAATMRSGLVGCQMPGESRYGACFVRTAVLSRGRCPATEYPKRGRIA